MGLSASLYRIDQKDFSKIIDNPKDFGLFKLEKGCEIFVKSFDGLQFVLLKMVEDMHKDLVEQIFFPNKFIGEQIDYSKLDFENLPDDFDFDEQSISYNDPNTVTQIHNLLETFSIQKFQENFDYEELNNHDIYPGDIWNNSKDDNIAFNVGHMTIEFLNLKSIYKEANDHNDYILSYVG